MTRAWLRFGELIALLAISAGLIWLCGYMIALNRVGEAFGVAIGAVLQTIAAIRNIGQAQAMQSMADALAQSSPVPPKDAVDVP